MTAAISGVRKRHFVAQGIPAAHVFQRDSLRYAFSGRENGRIRIRFFVAA
jgi:hypothetical protein